jgi:hypothetical protein
MLLDDDRQDGQSFLLLVEDKCILIAVIPLFKAEYASGAVIIGCCKRDVQRRQNSRHELCRCCKENRSQRCAAIAW